MDSLKNEMQDLIENLKTQRDELRVQIHLASSEAKEEFEKLETKWDEVSAKGKQIGEVAGDTLQSVVEDMKSIGSDLKSGYQKIKELI